MIIRVSRVTVGMLDYIIQLLKLLGLTLELLGIRVSRVITGASYSSKSRSAVAEDGMSPFESDGGQGY